MCQSRIALHPQIAIASDSLTGNFILGELSQSNDGKATHKARLVDTLDPSSARDLVPPLFNAEVVNVDGIEMTVCGYCQEFHPVLEEVVRYRQCWRLKIVPNKNSSEFMADTDEYQHTQGVD